MGMGPKTTVRSARGNSSSGWGVVEEGVSGGQPSRTLGVARSMYGMEGVVGIFRTTQGRRFDAC